MKAATYHIYGPPNVVTLTQVRKPVAKQNEVLIRIRATTVTTGDWRARSLTLPPGFGFMGRLVFGLLRPRQPILGTELAGVIEAVGQAVTQFKVGDEVFAFPGAKYGSHAEYRTMPEDGPIALKPANLSFEEAAALSFGGTTVLGPLRDRVGIKPGDKVLVVGASGGVGTAAVQIAKHLGAEVTGVCSTTNVDLVRSIGAATVIDYTREDFVQSGDSWDVIVDTTGSSPFSRCEPVLRRGGRLLVILGSFADVTGLKRPSRTSTKAVISGVGRIDAQDLRDLAHLASIGAYRPVIDRSYPLEFAAEAHAYVDTGRKRGNVVLTA
jgi:NADPH:quinone reductase-like Zn-dependent oxidoreductase